MTDSFPAEMGKELGGFTFSEVFQQNPKIIEFVSSCWTDDCTGLFKKFRKYVNERLENPKEKAAHQNRCREFVKREKIIPRYLNKYTNE